jgi:kinesin family member C2/C3
MDGSRDLPGVIPRAVLELFNVVRNSPCVEYTFSLTMLEIYNETIRDLLISNDRDSKETRLDIRHTADGSSVSGLTEISVSDAETVFQILERGRSNRAVGSHDLNEHSSRSHLILTIMCRRKDTIDGTATFGKLNLIDLAGSERVSKTDAAGDRLKEAQNINRSLSALGDVINALGNKKNTHVPYRNSKLTFLLQVFRTFLLYIIELEKMILILEL